MDQADCLSDTFSMDAAWDRMCDESGVGAAGTGIL